MTHNKVSISGVIESDFMLDHEYTNEKFYQFLLSVKRSSSGATDIIPVIVSERLIDVSKNMVGQYVFIEGEFRSFNHHEIDKTRLLLYIFPLMIKVIDSEKYTNDILLEGKICKEAIFRETPNGRIITDVLLVVDRNYNKCDYIPCIAWGRNAYYISLLKRGTFIRVAGRVQSRDYNKDCKVKTAYELSINLVELREGGYY